MDTLRESDITSRSSTHACDQLLCESALPSACPPRYHFTFRWHPLIVYLAHKKSAPHSKKVKYSQVICSKLPTFDGVGVFELRLFTASIRDSMRVTFSQLHNGGLWEVCCVIRNCYLVTLRANLYAEIQFYVGSLLSNCLVSGSSLESLHKYLNIMVCELTFFNYSWRKIRMMLLLSSIMQIGDYNSCTCSGG